MKSLKLIVDDSSKNRRVKTEEWSIATGKTTKGNQLLVSPKSKSNTPQIWNLESYEQQIEAIEGNLQLCQSLTDDMV